MLRTCILVIGLLGLATSKLWQTQPLWPKNGYVDMDVEVSFDGGYRTKY